MEWARRVLIRYPIEAARYLVLLGTERPIVRFDIRENCGIRLTLVFDFSSEYFPKVMSKLLVIELAALLSG
jgi:hypothetical protein